jgi:hypothetical protein
MAEAIKSIRLDELQCILYQEDSVIAAEDIPRLMDVIIKGVERGPLSHLQNDWQSFKDDHATALLEAQIESGFHDEDGEGT